MFTSAGPLPRFSSRIRFVTAKEFRRLPLTWSRSVNASRENNINTFNQTAYTVRTLMCNAGGVIANNPGKLVLFHFDAYEPGLLQEQLQSLQTAVAPLQVGHCNMRALLIGGESQYPYSVAMGEALKRFFRSAGIPFSVFWGHNRSSGSSDIAYSPGEDTWYVNTSYSQAPRRFSKNSKALEIESLGGLKSAFEEISLDPGDEVVIGNKTYQSVNVRKVSPSSRLSSGNR